MTDTSAASAARQARTKRSYNWRVVDIVVAALIAVAGGVIFWAWSQRADLISAPCQCFPTRRSPHCTPAAGSSPRCWHAHHPQAGRRTFCETVAATGELIMGSQYGTTGAHLRASCRAWAPNWSSPRSVYKKFNLPVSPLAGAGAGLFCRLERFVYALGLEHRLRRGDKLA